MATKKKKRIAYSYDNWMILSALGVLALGLLMVASASMVISDRHFGYPFHFLIHQAIYLVMGLVAAIIVMRLPLEFWEKKTFYLVGLSLLLLFVVLIPGIGHVVNGSRRWIRLGPVSLQVSELVKFAAIIFVAGYLVRREEEVQTKLSGFIKPMLLLGIFAVLLLLEPDFGAAAVIMATALGMMFLAGMRLWQFGVLFGLVAATLAVLAIDSPYRLLRLTTFMHPWANQFSSGYQLTQSLIAFGRGGALGVGLGNSIQKLFYLPEAHTDFLFAVLGEELGLLGELVVLSLFVVLVGRILMLAQQAKKQGQKFAAYLCSGFGLWIGLQAMINMGVNMGLLPTKGLTLPMMSYGGSSLILNCVVIGIVLRAAHEVRSRQ